MKRPFVAPAPYKPMQSKEMDQYLELLDRVLWTPRYPKATNDLRPRRPTRRR